MRLGVLGAGSFAGRRIARELIESAEVEEVLLFDPVRDVSGLADDLSSYGSSKCRAVASATEAMRGCSASVGAPTGDEDGVSWAALSAADGGHFVWCGDDPSAVESLLQADDKARASGATVIAGMGWSPGLTNILARECAEKLDRAREIRIAWAVSAGGGEGDEAVGRLMRSFARPPVIFEGGTWHRTVAGGAEEEICFPEPLGWVTVRSCAGAETLTIPQTIPTVERVIVKSGAVEKSVAILARFLSGATAMAQTQRQRRLRDAARPWLRSIRRGSSGGWSAIRVDVRGERKGRAASETLAVLDQLANLNSVPSAAATLMLAKGEVSEVGVMAPERAIDPTKLFVAMAARGVRVARLER